MKVEPSRLANALRDERFQLAQQACGDNAFVLLREDLVPDLFQWIWVNASGKRGEAVFAYAAVSVAKWIAFKGLMDLRPMIELGENPERGTTIIETDVKAQAWERKLIEYAPQEVSRFAAERGSALLETTKTARRSVAEYLKRVDLSDSAARALLTMWDGADETTCTEADRLMNWTAMQQIRGRETLYEMACLWVLRYSSEVDGACVSYFGQDPLENTDLMWRIQLIVDKLFTHFKT